MNVWFALAMIAALAAIGNVVVIRLCATGVLSPGGWAGYAARGASGTEWQNMHRAALPAAWVSTAVAVPTALVGGVLSGWGPLSGPSTLAALIVVGGGIAVGSVLARRAQAATA